MTAASKAALRKQLLTARPHESTGLTDQLRLLLAENPANSVASFQPIAKEPDVREFNSWAANRLQLLLPRMTGETLEFATGELEQGPFGIEQPVGKSAKPDLILVPAVAVDRLGNRLGRGKGVYDRALRQFPDALKFAVVYDEELVEHLPIDPWDQPVNGAVTPSGVWNFG